MLLKKEQVKWSEVSLSKTNKEEIFKVPLIWDSNTAYFKSNNATIIIDDNIVAFSIDMELVLNTGKIHKEYTSEESEGEYDYFNLDIWNIRMYNKHSLPIPIDNEEYIDLIFNIKKRIKW